MCQCLHQLIIFEVKLTQLKHVIGKGLALGEMLLKGADTAAQWMAAGVDNLGIGYDCLQQPDVGESCSASCQ